MPSYPKIQLPPTLHLLYHITPLGSWRENIRLLAPHIHIFNGCCTFVFALSPEQLKTKMRATRVTDVFLRELGLTFKPKHFQFIFMENDQENRESVTFKPLLEQLYKNILYLQEFHDHKTTVFPDQFAFYGHTKAITHDLNTNPGIALWRDEMYYQNLNRYYDCIQLLQTDHIKTVGSFRRFGVPPHFPKWNRPSTYHFSGTFFWFNVKSLAKRNSLYIPLNRYAVEAYPSQLFKKSESACLEYDDWGDLNQASWQSKLLSLVEQRNAKK